MDGVATEGAGSRIRITIRVRIGIREHAGYEARGRRPGADGRIQCLLKTVQHTGMILAEAGGLLQTLYGLYGLY